ncbi:MAG: alpha/beta hydrolase-fold protein [Archangium sp.]|nr:alpha/beta hydrolase-fold protein [Archangium sp.]MDP3573398.1 alpha/beta hydrolase-fold protein [Archangium sp.]
MRTLALLLCCSGCAVFMPAPTPMTSLRDELPGGDAKCLVVFLPGAGDKASDFVKYGFIEALRQKSLSVDVVAADATLGYYMRGLFPERVHADVVAPARAKGYQQTWVMGMSMGGMGTLLYSREHAADVNGVLLLAPFLGDRSLSEEIRAAGGLAAWQAPAKGPITSDTYQREVWRWLQGVTANKEPGPNLYLGWGTEDRLGESASLLAAALPEGHVFKVPGGHKWTSWKAVLDQFLADSDFTRSCAR